MCAVHSFLFVLEVNDFIQNHNGRFEMICFSKEKNIW